MADTITKEAVQAKLDKGETLTKEETQFVMQSTDGPDNDAQNISDEELGLEEEGKEKEKTPEGDKDKEKAEADEAAKKKSEEEAEAKKKEAETAKAKEEADKESFHEKVERTLTLEDKDINLEGYSEREKGLFWSLRKERKARQQAEADRDAERFERIKKQKLEEEAEAKAKEEKPAEDDEEFITKGELKERQKEEQKARDANEAARTRKVILDAQSITAYAIVESRKAKGEDLPDYDKAMEIGEILVAATPEYAKKIQEAWINKQNAALVIYELVRKDPRFKSLYNPDAPVAKKEDKTPEDEKKEKEGKENLKKIEENEKKPKTSGAQGGGGEGDYGEYTFDQLVKMTTSEFRKVPKKIREKFLKDAG